MHQIWMLGVIFVVWIEEDADGVFDHPLLSKHLLLKGQAAERANLLFLTNYRQLLYLGLFLSSAFDVTIQLILFLWFRLIWFYLSLIVLYHNMARHILLLLQWPEPICCSFESVCVTVIKASIFPSLGLI